MKKGKQLPVNRGELIDRLKHPRLRHSFVAMPDLYLDHLADFDGQPAELLSNFQGVLERGGGNVPGDSQEFCLGGNAANFSLTLSGLGGKVSLIARTSEFGLDVLKFFSSNSNVDLSHVNVEGQLSTSFIMEVKGVASPANLMISYPGEVRNFGFDRLTKSDLQVIGKSGYVCVFNWSQNRKGTNLATRVFEFARQIGGKMTFLDLGDPSWRMDEVPELVEDLSSRKLLDVLGVNENEVKQICKAMGLHNGDKPIHLAKSLSEKTGFEVALHTSTFAASCINGDVVMIPTFDLTPVKVTGAGDAWNAGFLFGDGIGLDRTGGILLANATAGAHILKRPGSIVTLEDVKQVIRSRSLIKHG